MRSLIVILAILTVVTGCSAIGPNTFDAAVKRVLNQEDPEPTLTGCIDFLIKSREIKGNIAALENQVKTMSPGPEMTLVLQNLQSQWNALNRLGPEERACGQRSK